MSVRALFVAILLAAMPVTAASPFKGENCQLASPPEAAGDEIVRAEIAKVHPRRKALPVGYTGCQVTWVRTAGGWSVAETAYFREGALAAFWRPPPDGALCEYRAGKASGSHAERCPAPGTPPRASMAPGCAEKILGRGGNAGCAPD